jgi:DNA (cytosine-5)-methyltransferase 1
MGYHLAGFEVVGVDSAPQPRYPFTFYQADALTFPLAGFDAYHASPPCQSYSAALKHLAKPQPLLIEPVRARFKETGKPWVIENVEGAPIGRQADLFGANGVMLCGTGFGLRVYRHRLFESNVNLRGPGCVHRRPAMNPHNQAGRERIYAEFGRQDPEKLWRREMGVAWMSKQEGREAIPPVFTEHIGRQLADSFAV